MTPNIALANNFFQAWNRRALNTILDCLAEDCVYHTLPMEPVRGRASIEAYIAPVIAQSSAIEWVVIAIAEDEQGRVLNERLDRLRINGRWLEIPLMGVLEFGGGKISLWRDYFDLQDYQRQKDRLSAT